MTAHEFFIWLGSASALATVIYVVLMVMIWPSITTWGQRLRFLCLLYAAGQFTYASAQLAQDPNAEIHTRSIGAAGFVVLLVITAIVSIHDLLPKRR